MSLVERDHRVERGPEPDIGFAQAAYAWAEGGELGEVLRLTGFTAGDLVRWIRQVIDCACQVVAVAGAGQLRTTCRLLVAAMRRGVVDIDVPGAD